MTIEVPPAPRVYWLITEKGFMNRTSVVAALFCCVFTLVFSQFSAASDHTYSTGVYGGIHAFMHSAPHRPREPLRVLPKLPPADVRTAFPDPPMARVDSRTIFVVVTTAAAFPDLRLANPPPAG
jgi:hypothetical protein